MISEFFLNIIFNIAYGFFSLLPDFSWDVETSAFSYLLSVLRVAGYMFPWGTVIRIVGIVIGLSLFRITVAFIKTIWDLLPFA